MLGTEVLRHHVSRRVVERLWRGPDAGVAVVLAHPISHQHVIPAAAASMPLPLLLVLVAWCTSYDALLRRIVVAWCEVASGCSGYSSSEQ